jgi:hypothetical protein
LMFIVFAALGVSIKLIAIQQLSNFWLLSIAVYISFNFLYHEMIQIRAGVAAGFLLLCIKPIIERNLKVFALFTAIAISFHISSLLIIPLWFLNTKRINRNLYILSLIVVYLAVISGLSLSKLIELIPIERVQILYQGYLLGTTQGLHSDKINLFSTIQLLKVSILLVLLLKVDTISRHSPFAILLVKINTLSVLSYAILSDIPVLAFRISQFLGVVEIITFPMIIYLFTERSRKIGYLVPLSVSSIFMGILLFYRNLI